MGLHLAGNVHIACTRQTASQIRDGQLQVCVRGNGSVTDRQDVLDQHIIVSVRRTAHIKDAVVQGAWRCAKSGAGRVAIPHCVQLGCEHVAMVMVAVVV
jgi:hypothetical protein